MEGGTTIDVCGHENTDISNYHGNLGKDDVSGFKHDPNGKKINVPGCFFQLWSFENAHW